MTAAGPSMANKSSPEALLGCLTARTAEEAELGNQEEEWGSQLQMGKLRDWPGVTEGAPTQSQDSAPCQLCTLDSLPSSALLRTLLQVHPYSSEGFSGAGEGRGGEKPLPPTLPEDWES